MKPCLRCSAVAVAAAFSVLLARRLLILSGKGRTAGRKFHPSPRGNFVVSVDDGYVEYSYGWELPEEWSIDTVVRKMSAVLGPPSSPGEIRDGNASRPD